MEGDISASALTKSPKAGSQKTGDYICCVCGDAATNYRFYGASSVCYSCRIFFRRVVTAKQEFKCNRSGTKTKMCSFDKFTRNQCKKCRFEKCISVGLLPFLVNTTNRKNIKALEKIKRSSSEQEIQALKGENQNSTPAINILFCPGLMSNESIRLKPEDLLLDNGLISGKVSKLFEDVYFNENMDENLSLYCSRVESMNESCIQQIRQKSQCISLPSDAIEVSFKVLLYFTRDFLSIFLPQTDPLLLEEIAENININIMGLSCAIDGCFQSENLLDQWKREFFPAENSEKIRNYYLSLYPDIETLDPVRLEMFDTVKSPYAKCKSDEDFVDSTRQRLRDLLMSDQHLGKLIYLLTLFSPVKLNIPEKENRLLLEYQQKISIMIYSHLMGRNGANNLTSASRMASVVSMMEDFNKVGTIFHSGLIVCPRDGALDLDCIEIESLA